MAWESETQMLVSVNDTSVIKSHMGIETPFWLSSLKVLRIIFASGKSKFIKTVRRIHCSTEELHYKEPNITECKSKVHNMLHSLKYLQVITHKICEPKRAGSHLPLYSIWYLNWEVYRGYCQSSVFYAQLVANEINVIKWVALISSENKSAPTFLKEKTRMAQAVKNLCETAAFSTPAHQC